MSGCLIHKHCIVFVIGDACMCRQGHTKAKINENSCTLGQRKYYTPWCHRLLLQWLWLYSKSKQGSQFYIPCRPCMHLWVGWCLGLLYCGISVAACPEFIRSRTFLTCFELRNFKQSAKVAYYNRRVVLAVELYCRMFFSPSSSRKQSLGFWKGNICSLFHHFARIGQ